VPPQQPSDWWTRARAFLLDQLIVAAIALAGALAAKAVIGDPSRDTLQLVVYAIAIPVGLLYAPVLMARGGARNGQTLGKQIVGIRVVRTDGAPVSFWLGVLRSVVAQQLLTAVTAYAYAVVDYLWPLRDPHNQALHDKIAKTWVLRVPAIEPQPLPQLRSDELPVQGWLPPRAPGR
jgi:uncharacterized RDD family membrane protein YckC